MDDDPLKLLTIGDPGVGKTCLLNRIYGEDFGEPKEDWESKRLPLTSNGITRDVILTDTAGQERFRELTSASYKYTDIVFVVFAVDSKESFNDCTKWLGEADRYVTNKSIPRVIVANKVDLESRVVSTEEAQAFATSKGALYLETSAKTGQNIQEMVRLTLEPPKPAKEGGGCCLLQ